MKTKRVMILAIVLLIFAGTASFFLRPGKPVLGAAVTEENGILSSLAEAENWDGKVPISLNSLKTDFSSAGGGFQQAKEEEVVRLVNEARAGAGLAPLTLDYSMVGAAEVRAQEQMAAFSHTRPNGSNCFTVYAEYGINASVRGENLGAGSACSARQIVDAWMNSEAHRVNILDSRYSRIAVGCFESGGKGYWAQLFAG